MCYSFKTSIIAYILGLISAIIAFLTGQYILGSLIFCYCQMQLSEALIWRGIDTHNLNLNRIGTKFGQYALPLHLFAVGIGYLLAVYFKRKTQPTLKDYIPLAIGIAFYLFVIIFPYRLEKYGDVTFPENSDCRERKCQNVHNRLVWPYPQTWYALLVVIFIVLIFIIVKPLASKIFIISVFGISLIVSNLLFSKAFPSFWCFISAFGAPLIVLGNYLIIKNLKEESLT